MIEYAIMLLEELSTENVGITYLTNQEKAIPLLIDILTGEVCFIIII